MIGDDEPPPKPEPLHNWKEKPYTDPKLFKPPVDLNSLEHCPSFNDRFVLQDGVTRAIPYPQTGFNCNKDWAALSMQNPADGNAKGFKTDHWPKAEKGLWAWGAAPYTDPKLLNPPADLSAMESCPNMVDRHVLLNGRTLAVPYPEKGYNCQNWGVYLQTSSDIQADPKTESLHTWDAAPYASPGILNPPADLNRLEFCPNMVDRHVLNNGRTLAIAYPEKGYNC